MPRHDTTKESSLPKAREWLEWLAYQHDNLPGDDGVARLFRDVVVLWHHNIANCARRLRKRPGWDIQGTMRDDTVRLEEEARHAYNVLTRNLKRRDLAPDWANAFDALEGGLKQQIRLAREIDVMQAQGFIDIAVTTDRQTGKIIEEKFA